LPDYGHVITIRHLLNHTSGIRDQWQSLAIAGWSLEDVITQGQILRVLFRQKELNFPPGSRHFYSNGGFTLAAEIVARVSGRTFPEFCQERIFQPLGMEHTHFHQDLTQIVPGRAYSYGGAPSHYVIIPLNYANVGATSLFSTAHDLVIWLDNFRAPKLGTAAIWARLQEPGILNDGTKLNYGLGLGLGQQFDQRVLQHAGGDAGFRSNVVWFPEAELGIAVAANLASINPVGLCNAIASHVLDIASAKPAAAAATAEEKRTFVTLPPEELEQYAGTYPLPQIGQRAVFEVRDGKLWAAGPVQPPLEVRPVGGRKFHLAQLSADIEFVPQDDDGMKIVITQPGAVNEGVRTDPVILDAAALIQYEGDFWSDEMLTQYTVAPRDGKLWLSHLKHGEGPLEPTAPDAFASPFWFSPEVKFVRDASGSVTAATLGGGRVTGVTFRKVAR
jgi:CubicO group peptidase (beta-lactamase class C family)